MLYTLQSHWVMIETVTQLNWSIIRHQIPRFIKCPNPHCILPHFPRHFEQFTLDSVDPIWKFHKFAFYANVCFFIIHCRIWNLAFIQIEFQRPYFIWCWAAALLSFTLFSCFSYIVDWIAFCLLFASYILRYWFCFALFIYLYVHLLLLPYTHRA